MLFESKKETRRFIRRVLVRLEELELLLALLGAALVGFGHDRMLAAVVAKVLSARAGEFRLSSDIVSDCVDNSGGVDIETFEKLHEAIAVFAGVESEVETFDRDILFGDAVDGDFHDPGAVGILIGQGDGGVVFVHVVLLLFRV